MKILAIFASFVFALAPVSAFCHTTWTNGDPVPPYVKESCCGPADAHHLTPDQVHSVQGGYKIDGYKDIVPYNIKTVSPDGEWWIFYRDDGNGFQSPVYCLFGPSEGV